MTLTGQPTAASMMRSDQEPQLGCPSICTTLVVSVTWKTSEMVSSQRSQTMQPGMIQTFSTVPLLPVGDALPPRPLSTMLPSASVPGACAGAGAVATAAPAGAAAGLGFAAGFSCFGFAFGLRALFSGRHQSITCGTRV